jgi:aspartyl-tRNA(Asn)/glutamyl-tRNA(Gln) amidotransferase subunit C
LSQLNAAQVEQVAKLARLDLSADEISRYQKDLSAIVGYIDSLSEVDTSGVDATLGVQPHSNVLREDLTRPSLGAAKVLINAPSAEMDGFQIPRILEEG